MKRVEMAFQDKFLMILGSHTTGCAWLARTRLSQTCVENSATTILYTLLTITFNKILI